MSVPISGIEGLGQCRLDVHRRNALRLLSGGITMLAPLVVISLPGASGNQTSHHDIFLQPLR